MGAELKQVGHGRGNGKVILLGEHAVVYGQPALAAGLPLGVEATIEPNADGTREVEAEQPALIGEAAARAAALLDVPAAAGFRLTIRGDLPVAVGLGSSAALAVALIRAFAAATATRLADDVVAQRANRIEEQFHGRPSGIDATTATLGGVLRFRRGATLEAERVPVAGNFRFALLDTGTSHTTSSTVGALAAEVHADPSRHESLFAEIGELARTGEAALRAGDPTALGAAMNENHPLLARLGVSTPELESAVAAARAGGALGAKLTGAGGGGVVLALVEPGDEGFAARLRAAGYPSRSFELAPGPGE